jgi:hypothetical protein
VKHRGAENAVGYRRQTKFFPTLVLKILPAGVMVGLGFGVSSGCHSATTSVEASTTRNPVVAPAGTVLRVRLDQTLETGRSRPGDRFSGTLDAPVVSGGLEVLPKGTKVQGHIEPSRGAALSFALDCFAREGGWYALSTKVVSRTGNAAAGNGELRDVSTDSAIGGVDSGVAVRANSIVGFTLAFALTA